MYIGSFNVGDTVHHKWTMVNSSGVPTAWNAREPSLYVYQQGNTVTSVAANPSPGGEPKDAGAKHGVWWSTGYNGFTGLNHVFVSTASDSALYTSGNFYQLVVATGFIGTDTVAGYVVLEFGLRTEIANVNQAQTLTIPATTQSTVGQALVNMHYATDYMSFTLPASPTQSTVGHALMTARQATEYMNFTLPASPTANTVGQALKFAREATEYLDVEVSTRATPAQVNTEVVDALATDTYAEPAQGAPAATAALTTKIGFLYKFLRNRITQTSTTLSIYNDDATTVDHKSTVSDDATTYDRGEIASGP